MQKAEQIKTGIECFSILDNLMSNINIWHTAQADFNKPLNEDID